MLLLTKEKFNRFFNLTNMLNPIIITLPIISEDCKDLKVSKILFTKGKYIQKGEPFLEVETEKATIELPSEFQGKIIKPLIKTNDEITVGTPICVLLPNNLTNINDTLSKFSDELKSLEELQDFYYNLVDILDISYKSTPEKILSIIKKKFK
ncbi:hypothetical protein TFA04_520002 [Tenacibaculum maritimum]|nr:hypothetical protein TFA04_520002 [Tenacibaculum maritimum]